MRQLTLFEIIKKENKIKYDREYCQKNKEKIKIRKRIYNEHTKEHRKEYSKQYRQKNKEFLKRLKKEYEIKNRDKNRVKKRESCKKFYLKHREKRIAYHKDYREKNKDYFKKFYIKNKEKYSLLRKNNKERYNIKLMERRLNFNVKIATYMRSRIRSALKSIKCNKRNSIKILVGCSVPELKTYLESKFKEGMNWENYGKWHIDHIIGCCNFDLTNIEEQKKCFHYSNLQPLWAIENLRKSKFIKKV